MQRRVVLVRHDDEPPLDRVQAFLAAGGFAIETRRPYRGEPLPPPDDGVLGTVVFGGPFAVTETRAYPFLRDEARWLEQCMARGLPVLGICQGAQAIAHLLGARVGPLPGEPHEFGWYPVYGTDGADGLVPPVLHVTQAHFHGFDLPAGATLLARGDTFPQQAFRVGTRTLALQFHAEVTRAGLRRWQAAAWAPWGRPGVQTREQQDALAEQHDAAQERWFRGVLAGLFGHAEPTASATAAGVTGPLTR